MTQRRDAPRADPELRRNGDSDLGLGPCALSGPHRPTDDSAMRESRQFPPERDPHDAGPSRHDDRARPEAEVGPVEPLRLPPLFSRRHNPWLLVEVDAAGAGHGALVWAL